MRKIVPNCLLMFTILFSAMSLAEASPFSSCSTPRSVSKNQASDSLTSKDLFGLSVRFGQTFERTVADGLHDIEINLSCLDGQKKQPLEICDQRRSYFLSHVPSQWKKLRQALALSSFSKRFVLHKDERRPYNFELEAPSYARATSEKIEALEGSEFDQADKEWATQYSLAKKVVLKEIQQRLSRTSGLQPAELSSQRNLRQAQNLIENWPMHMVFRSDNPWAQKVFFDIDSIVFKLNRKRTLQLLARYPILAHLRSKDIDEKAIIVALQTQREQLKEESQRVAKILTALSQKSEVFYMDVQPLFDYHFIVDLTLAQNPDLCSPATFAFNKIETRTQVKSAVLLLGMIGIAPFIPFSWTLLGASAMQASALFEANQKANSAKNLAYGFSSPDLAAATAEDVFFERVSVENEWIMTASIVTGMPLMRLSKLAIRSLPAVKSATHN